MRKLRLSLAPLLTVVAAIVVLVSAGPGPAGSAANEELLWRYRNLGKALFETPTTVAQSAVELKKALDLAPNSFRERVNYGLALLRSGNNKDAITELTRAQKQEPAIPHTWFNLGIAFKREGRYPEAIRQFEQMIKLVPDEPVSHYNLGLLYNLTGKEQEAIKQFEIAARLDPNLVAPRFQLYNVYRLLGRDEEAAKALAVFQDAKARQKAADDSEDMEWSYYAELYDPIQARPAAQATPAAELKFQDRKLAGAADAKTAGLLVIDSTGAGNADLLAWSRDGIRLYRKGSDAVENSGLEGIKGVISVAAGDIDNDELPDLAILTESGPLLYRNVKGRFQKKDAALPAGRFEKAVWLDYDHDYDLDLFLFGAKSVLLRNEGDALADHTSHFPFVQGRVTDAVPFRVVPDTKATDLAVSYADRAGVLYSDQMRGVYTSGPLAALPAGAKSLRSVDIDNDSWIDLAYTAPSGVGVALNREGRFRAAPAPYAPASAFEFADLENRGVSDLVAGNSVYRNLGLTKFAAARVPAGFPAAPAWAEADFDADGRADLAAVAPDGSLHAFMNQTATKNQWIRVSLTGVKNLKAGTGTEVETKAGNHYQKKIYQGVPLLFGLGTAREIDTVRISWPNGLIQNQTNEPVARAATYKEAPRLSGSCPMVFAWNGREFQFISDVLGTAPLGASSGDGSYFPVDSDEYLHLPEGSLAPRNGKYEIRITEELHEISYIDQTRLIAVDHPAAVELFTNDKFKAPPFPEFRLFGVRHRIYPRAARDYRGRGVLQNVLRRDRVYAAGFQHDYAGRAEMHALELDFGPHVARDNRAILVLNGWIDWADGSTFMAASQGNQGGLVMPYLQVKDAAGRWRTVIEDMGVPSGGPKTIVVDLTGKFLSASREVRIVTNTCLFWDEVFLSEETAAPPVKMTSLDPASAHLDLRGFSRAVLDPRREQPESYQYAHWVPEAMWNPIPGVYTRFGDVTELMRVVDDRFVIMGSGDELRITFDARALPPVAAGWKRDFLLLVDGWSKDGDPNTAFSQTVEPLPFHGMSQYPYPASERFPNTPEHRAWREHYNTRRAIKLMPSLARAAK
jgi:tetratricopeptide (TPR) repeat protein